MKEHNESTVKKLKALYNSANMAEKKRLQEILEEISKDPHYKENMLEYFKQFLLKRY